MPWGTVRRSAPGPGPLPAAADANLSAEPEGAAERGLRRQHSLRGLIKGKLRIRKERKAASRHERAGPSEARCRGRPAAPTRDRRAAHPLPPPTPRIATQGRGTGRDGAHTRCGLGAKAGERGPRRGAGPTRAPSPSHALPRRGERGAHPGPAAERRLSLRWPVPRLINHERGGGRRGRGGRPWSPGAPGQRKKSSLRWEGRTGSGSQGNDAPEGKAFPKGGGRVGMLEGLNGGSVCSFFPGEESGTSLGTDPTSRPEGWRWAAGGSGPRHSVTSYI